MKIITDHKWHDFKYAYEAPFAVRQDYPDEFDGFIKYRGSWYHMTDFIQVTEGSELIGKFEGLFSVHAFCAIAIKVSEDGEKYQIGRILT